MTTPDLVDPRLSALADGRLIVTGRGFDSYVAATETDDGWSLRSLDNLMPTGAGTTITVLQTAFTDHGTFVVATAGFDPVAKVTGEITVLDPTTGEVVDTFTAPEIEEALAAIQDEDKGYATSDLWVLYSTDGENWSVDAASEIGIDDFSNGVDGVFTTDSTIALRVLGALPAGSGDEITDTVVVGTTGG